ncbi:MAG: sigma-70 family RNA polymerase sigma factor [Oscillospiraceae bacterium]|nr:sigma-70 family RNA polymerase sigma factor [Oscillospiraceae bacterium]
MNAADIAVKENRDKLVTDNIGLVHLCANRFRNRGVEYEELYSSGCIGLVKAAGSFDENRGVKFSTYAVPVILGEIKRIFRDGGTVKVSRSLKELSMRAIREKNDFIARNGREPGISELAEIMGCEPAETAEALSAAQPCISLTRYGDSDENEEQDIPSPFREADIYESIALRQAMDRLDAEDRKLIFLRYFRSFTQSKAAAVLGMTQVQVSRREKKILSELRKELL